MLFVVTSMLFVVNADTVSDLANDVAFIIGHFGTTLAEGGQPLKSLLILNYQCFCSAYSVFDDIYV
jgi:hypothetical protein